MSISTFYTDFQYRVLPRQLKSPGVSYWVSRPRKGTIQGVEPMVLYICTIHMPAPIRTVQGYMPAPIRTVQGYMPAPIRTVQGYMPAPIRTVQGYMGERTYSTGVYACTYTYTYKGIWGSVHT